MDFRKTFCVYHPSQTVTNFCTSKTCFVPLCPTCVCMHLEFHMKNGTNPTLNNITDIIGTFQNSIFTNVTKLETVKNKIQNIEKSNKDLIYKISELIFQAKLNMKQLIDKRFAEIQTQIFTTIQNKNKEVGLHCPQKIKIFEDKLIKQLNELNQLNFSINSDKSLQALISYLSTKRNQTESLIQESQKFIDLNQSYKIDISLNKSINIDIHNTLSRLINIRFNIPKFEENKIAPIIIRQDNFLRQNSPMNLQSQQNSQIFRNIENMVRPMTPVMLKMRNTQQMNFNSQIKAPQQKLDVSKISNIQIKQNQKIQKRTGISLQKRQQQQLRGSKMTTASSFKPEKSPINPKLFFKKQHA